MSDPYAGWKEVAAPKDEHADWKEVPVREPSPTGWRDVPRPPPEPPADESFWQTAKRKLFGRPGEAEAMREKFAREAPERDAELFGTIASALHGPAMAMEGPINGAIAAVKQDATNLFKGEPFHPQVSPMQAYRKERDRIESEQKQNVKDHPWAPLIGTLVTNPGSAPTSLGRLGLGAAQGGLYALGESDADLTKGEFAEAGKDVAKGAGIGLGAAGAGEAFQLPARWLGGKAKGIFDSVHAKELADKADEAAGAISSRAGAEGNKTAGSMKMWGHLKEAANDPGLSEEKRAAAQAYLDSPEGRALYEQVIGNYLESAPSRLADLKAAKEATAAAIAANKPELIEQAAKLAADAKLGDTSGITKRVAEVVRRNAYPAIGGMVAGPPGAAAGAMMASGAGKQGTILANAAKQAGWYEPLKKASELGIGAGEKVTASGMPLAEYFGFLEGNQPIMSPELPESLTASLNDEEQNR